MTSEELLALADEVRRVCPNQKFTEADLANWRKWVGGFRYSECLIAVALLRHWHQHMEPERVHGRVSIMRSVAAQPEYQPGGKAWEENLAAHGGREFEGGPVCWDPRVACEGICRVCPVRRDAS